MSNLLPLPSFWNRILKAELEILFMNSTCVEMDGDTDICTQIKNNINTFMDGDIE
jgi:hypothetical protein